MLMIIFVLLFLEEYPTRTLFPKGSDFGIVNIAKEPTPIEPNNEIPSNRISSVMDTSAQETFVTAAKPYFNQLDEDLQRQQQQQQPQSTITATEQIVPIPDDNRK